MKPFNALVLLISAMGHDVGHPGVNNMFLVRVKATVAQLYNDHSVLESFHCALYSQLLRRFWPSVGNDTAIRKLMISSILATDMTLHGQYTKQLDVFRDFWDENDRSITSWDEATLETNRELLSCLIIKCGDICNVVCLRKQKTTLIKVALEANLCRLATLLSQRNGRLSSQMSLQTKVVWN